MNTLFPLITPYPHFAKLPNCRYVRRRLSYTAPHLPRTRRNCGKPVSLQTTIYFSDSSIPAINESEELASRSMADVQVTARPSGHPSKYWLRAALLECGDRRNRAPTAHLPLSVIFNLTINKILNQRLFENCCNDNNMVVFIQVSAVVNNYTFSPFLC